jgi:diguanylate cyclase (GGDEF)-like protein
MQKEIQAEFDGLKKDYLSLEKTYQNEKDCLMKVVSTFGLIVDMSPEYREAYQRIKPLLQDESVFSVDRIHQETSALRSSIFSDELKNTVEAGDTDQDKAKQKQLLEAYKVLDKIAITLTDDFYPVDDEMKKNVHAVRFDFKNGMPSSEFDRITAALLTYMEKLKIKISDDFRDINHTFLGFFNQVRELEKVLTKELHADGSSNGFDDFEQEIHKEVGSIVDSFSLYSTINEVKNAVIDRLSKIKQMIAKKKKAEKDKSKKTQKQILWLRKKISQAETESKKLSLQAHRFKEEANKDGLTGLFNRSAFDAMIAKSLEAFDQGGDSFLLVMFDVDNFKWVNDTFGHVAGDKILQKVATALGKTFRKDEFIARYGGDEFVVVIEGLAEKTARKRISTFKETFNKMRFASHKDGDVQIGISAGIASAAKGDTPDDLIHKADSAMYEVKKKRKIKS